MRLREKISDMKERSRIARVLFNKYFIATSLFLLIVLFIDKNNAIKWIQNEYHVHQQEKLIRQYRSNILKADEQLKELTSNKDSLEKFARERYFFQKNGEEVYIMETVR